jgi:hypothetical protein
MKRNFLFGAILIITLFSSCSRELFVNYQTETANTGKIIIKPNKSTSKTNVTINDKLIVDGKKLKKLTINNVPEGDYKIHYSSDSHIYKTKIDTVISIQIKGGKEITKLVTIPPYSTGFYIYIIGSLIFLSLFPLTL